MNGNPFYIQPAGDMGQGLAGLGAIFGQNRERDRLQAIQDKELARQDEFNAALAGAFAPPTAQDQPMAEEEYVPKFDVNQVIDFNDVIDPKRAQYERQALAEMGIDTPEKLAEVKKFASENKNAPPELLRRNTMDRLKMVADRGGDARDTAKLLNMPQEEAKKVLSVVDMITDYEQIRKMAAIDPIATQRILEAGQYKGDNMTDLGRKMGLMQDALSMEDGPEKDAILMMIGAKPKSLSFDEKMKEAQAKSALAIKQLMEEEGIKTDAAILTEMRKQTETPEGQMKLAKNNAEILSLKANAEAQAYDAKDSLDLITSLETGDLDSIYGRGESIYPELLRSQKGIDLFKQRERLTATIVMARRGELKGQGAVSDSDQKMLENAATILKDPNISPELARQELKRVREIIQRSMSTSNQTATDLSGAPGTPAATGESAADRLARLRASRQQ